MRLKPPHTAAAATPSAEPDALASANSPARPDARASANPPVTPDALASAWCPQRRQLLQWPLAAAAGAGVAAAAPEARAQQPAQLAGPRFALLIGNRQYPAPYDLPSIGKNVQDMAAVLAQRGFEVTALVDLDLAQARQAVDRFAQTVKAASDDATVLFYFSGHGVQVDAENLLVAAGVNPTAAPETILKGSLVLGPDVMARLPRPAKGLLITVVDACRTNLRAPTPGEGLNQVEAPPGCLIAFSTGAGKPALAPAVETVNTFYTAALVKQLGSASDELTFSDLFRLAKLDTQRTMLNHPVALIRQFAQFPFIAENLPVPVLLAQRPAATPAATAVAAAVKRFSSEDESRDWASLQATLWPPDVLRQADTYLTRYPDSKLAGGALVAREGASESAALLAKGEIRLFRRSFDPAAAGGAGGSTGGGYGSSPGYGTANTASVDEAYRAELLKAARGDKDAAARIARRWRSAAAAGTEASRYEGWLQYAAELGNGIASYELALHYRRLDQPQAAARWEARSRELGYTPPPSLDNRRK